MATKKGQTEVSVLEIKVERIDFCLLGRTGIILNKMARKGLEELLLPRGRKSAAERAQSLKHNPVMEFRSAPYTIDDDAAPTYLAHLSSAFKKALAAAAIDIPGASKAQIARLVNVEGNRIPLYGIPKLHMAITRGADMNHTPDVRTRAIVPEWAVRLTVTYPTPILRVPVIANLLAAAGIIQGVGDWRPQKGAGNFGQFELVSEDDPRFVKVIKEGGREAQKAAMQAAEPFDEETEELLSWFKSEVQTRGFKEAVA